MSLPKLASFDENIKKLHQTVRILGPITHIILDKQPNWLHLALDILPFGVRTQKFPEGGQITVNFKARTVLYARGSGTMVQYKLDEFNQKTLFETVLAALEKDELAGAFDTLEGDTRIEKIMRKIYANKPEGLQKALADHSNTEPLLYELEFGHDYSDVIYMFFTAFSRWRARLNGHLSPIVIWSEHFDMSTLWFESSNMDEEKAHINIGFAPFTADSKFTRPYFYAYAYPYREDMTMPELSKPLKWEQDIFKGIYADYDDIAAQPYPENYIEQLCEKSFAHLQDVLKSDDTPEPEATEETPSDEASDTATEADVTSEDTSADTEAEKSSVDASATVIVEVVSELSPEEESEVVTEAETSTETDDTDADDTDPDGEESPSDSVTDDDETTET